LADDNQTIIESTNWTLNIRSIQKFDKSIPVVCGLTSISLNDNQVGLYIEATLEPSKSNKELSIDIMKDYIVKSDNNIHNPASMCISLKDKNLEIDQQSGVVNDLSKTDYPANVAISYIVKKSNNIVLIFEDSKPLVIN
jgi:hypothetical protein